MKKYVGITIGPIYDTILEASTPATLWFASNLFSDITKRICHALLAESAFAGVQLLSPYYAEDIRENDGVGKYHDRIIFSAEELNETVLKSILDKVKRETENNLPKDVRIENEDFFESYLQIHYIILEESEIDGSAILTLSPYLDMLELMKTFPKENTLNPFRKMFAGEEGNSNKFVKSSRMFRDIVESQFKKEDGSIWTIEEIASDHGKISEKLKKTKYYAMVQADGDGMGEFLKALSGNDHKVTEFSKRCLKYDEAAADMIGKFGGMTIYAGGDDLLFLAPVENGEGETIFSLCYRIAEKFQEIINSYDYSENDFEVKIPTLSFGISIQYSKSPLYEAHQNSGKLLYIVKNNVAEKNSMAIELCKHSGQSIGIVISNNEFEVLEKALKIGAGINNLEEKVTSVIQNLETFRSLILIMNQDERIKNHKESYQAAFMNLFDNPGQKAAMKYLMEICDYYYENFVVGNTTLEILPDLKQEGDNTLTTLLYVLRLKKFMYEKGEA